MTYPSHEVGFAEDRVPCTDPTPVRSKHSDSPALADPPTATLGTSVSVATGRTGAGPVAEV